MFRNDDAVVTAFAALLNEVYEAPVGTVSAAGETVTMTVGAETVTMTLAQAHSLANRLRAAADDAADALYG
jgi:hypothetical protein